MKRLKCEVEREKHLHEMFIKGALSLVEERLLWCWGREGETALTNAD